MPSADEARRGVVLFGHGSRDPLWRAPIEACARRMQSLSPGLEVRCAYLELSEPDLPSAVAGLRDDGVRSVTVVPMFLGVGRHAREDLPGLVEGLRALHPDMVFALRPAVGEDQRVIDLLARIALET